MLCRGQSLKQVALTLVTQLRGGQAGAGGGSASAFCMSVWNICSKPELLVYLTNN